MIFHKYETERGYVINELYDDEFVTYCTECDKEMKLESEDIRQILGHGGSFDSSSFKCNKCSDAS